MSRLINNQILLITAFLAVGLLGAFQVFAAPNLHINYQGKLTDTSGAAVADGDYHMRFYLYDTQGAATTSAIWTETWTGSAANRVSVTNGLFSVMLGSTTALSDVDFNQTLYLGVEIGGSGGTPSWDGEMSPRKTLGTVPAAFEAVQFDGLATTSFLRADADDTATGTITFTATTTHATSTFDLASTTNLRVGGDTFSDLTGAGLILSGNTLTASITSSVIVDGTIAETDLNINAPTDEYIMIASSTAVGGFEWVATSTARLGFVQQSDLHDAVTLAGTPDYLTLSGQEITLNRLDIVDDLNTFTSANFTGRLTDETGTGAAVFAGSPTFTGTANFASLIANSSSTISELNFTNATGTVLVLGGDRITEFAGTGLTVSGNALTADLGTDIAASEIADGDHGAFTYTSGSASLDNDVVAPDDVLSTGQTDEYCLTYESTGDTWEWADCSGATTFTALTDTPGSFNANRIFFTNAAGSAVADDADFTFATSTNTLTVGGMTLADGLTTHSVVATTTVPNNEPYAWTIATSSAGIPLFRINTTAGAESVQVGDGAGDIFIGGVGSASNLIFEESSTIHGQGTNVITLGIAGDTFNVAPGVTFNIATTTADGVLNVASSSANTLVTFTQYGAGDLLNIYDGASEVFTILDGGNVGVSSSTPWQTFSVAGDMALTGALFDSNATSGTDGYVLQTTGSATQWVATSSLGFAAAGTESLFTDDGAFTYLTSTSDELSIGTSTIGNAKLTAQSEGTSDILNLFETGGSEVLTVLESGNVGIGTTSPTYKLSVNGDIYGANITATGTVTTANFTIGGDTFNDLTGAGLVVSGNVLTASITPAVLNDVDSPGDEECLTYESTGTAFEWQSCGGGSSDFLSLTDTPSAYTANRVFFTNAAGSAVADDADFTFATSSNTLTVGGISLSDTLISHTGSATTTVPDGAAYAWTIATSTSGNPLFRIDTTGAGSVSVGTVGSDVYIGEVGSASNLIFEESSTISGQGENTITLGVGGDTFNVAPGVTFNIGTTSSSGILTVSSSTSQTIATFRQYGTGDILNLFDGATEVLTVLDGGNVGVGSTTAAEKLTVAGNIAPSSNLTYDLGTNGLRWNEAWVGTMNVGTSTWSIWNGSNGRLAFSDAASQGGTERLSILTNGNVGIGTTSPTDALQVAGDARLDSGTVGGKRTLGLYYASGSFPDYSSTIVQTGASDEPSGTRGLVINANTGDSTNEYGIGFAIDDSNKLFIQGNSGNVGIGTTTPSTLLHIDGIVTADQYRSSAVNVETVSGTYSASKAVFRFDETRGIGYNSADDRLYFAMFDSVPMVIDNSGNVGIGTTTPDAKLQVAGDGTGSGNEQLVVSGSTNANKRLRLGYDTTDNFGRIQAVTVGSSFDNLALNPNGGNVGIGTTSPTGVLSVEDNIGFTCCLVYVDDEGGNDWGPFVIEGGSNSVGIGTSTPDEALVVSSGGNTVAAIETTGSSVVPRLQIRDPDNGTFDLSVGRGSRNTFSIYAKTTDNEILTVNSDNSGGVGIGDDNPDATLEIVDTGRDVFHISSAASGDGDFVTVDTNGNVGIGTMSPTARLNVKGLTHITGAGTPPSGIGMELEWDGTQSDILSYDRDSSNYQPMRLRGSKLTFTEGTTDVITIDGSWVGIGTSTPEADLEISDTQPRFRLSDTSAVGAAYDYFEIRSAVSQSAGDYEFILDNDTDSDLSVMYFEQGGGIGIGNKSPALKLHVGSTSVTDTTDLLRLEDANSSCDYDADTGSGSCTSDETLKTDIEEIDNELLTVSKLAPVFYRWKTDSSTSTPNSGFIAQQVQEVLPELVSEHEWKDGSTKLSLNMGGMMPYVVGAIGEQQLTLDELLATGTSTIGTSSPFHHLFDGEEDTVWEKLVSLANNFIDGVLRVAGIETKIVYTKEVQTDTLCVGEVCVTEAEFREVFGPPAQAGSGSAQTASTGGGGSGGSTDTASDTTTNDGSGTGTSDGEDTDAGGETGAATGDTATTTDTSTSTKDTTDDTETSTTTDSTTEETDTTMSTGTDEPTGDEATAVTEGSTDAEGEGNPETDGSSEEEGGGTTGETDTSVTVPTSDETATDT